MPINYLAILVSAIVSMIVGIVWYGPLFGKKWLEIIGATPEDLEARRKMQRSAAPLYLVQFLLTFFQVLVLALFVAGLGALSLANALLVWAAFIVPTLAGVAMWNNDPTRVKWARFLIQGGYQLIMFIIYGLILGFWI